MPGPEDFSVSIPITADPTQLDQGLNEAVQKAQQKGQEAGQAYVQGMAAGAANGGVGGGINGPGLGGNIGGVGGGVVGPGVPGSAAAGIGGGSGGSGVPPIAAGGGMGWNSPAMGSIQAIGQAGEMALLTKAVQDLIVAMKQVGSEIGKTAFQTTDARLDLSDAQMEAKMVNADAHRAFLKTYADRTKGTDANPYLAERAAAFDDIATSKEFAVQDAYEDLGLAGKLDYGLARALGARGMSDTYDKELNANKWRAKANAKFAEAGSVMAGVGRYQMGNIVADAADSAGVSYSPSLRNAGGSVGIAGAVANEEALRGNTDAIRILVQTLNNPRGQAKFIADTLRGSPQTQQGGD